MKKKIILLFAFTVVSTWAFAQSYDMQINVGAIFRNNNSKCSSRVELTFVYESGYEWTWTQSLTASQGDWRFGGTTFNMLPNDRVVGIRTEAWRYTESCFLGNCDCDLRAHGTAPLISISTTEYPCFTTRRITNAIPGYESDSYLNIIIRPKAFPLTGPSDNILPSRNDITLQTPVSYNGYTWLYNIDGESVTEEYNCREECVDYGGYEYCYTVCDYRTVPVFRPITGLGSGNSITFSGEGLFGANVADYYFKNIFFKATFCGYETAVVNLRHLPSAPGIDSTTHVQQSCYQVQDAKLKIYFDRPLYSNELLYVYVNGTTFETEASDLDAENSFTISGQSPGTYNVTLQTTFGAGNTGYSDGPNHRDSEIIEPRTAISNFSSQLGNVNCFGGEDGKITISAQGGTGTYTSFLHLPDNTTQNIPLSASASNTFSNLKEGEYLVRLKDSNGCDPKTNGVIDTLKVTVTQPVRRVSLSLFENEEPKGFGLQNGYITVRSDNGTGMYTFAWTDSLGNSRVADAPVVEGSSMKSTLSGLGKGSYHVRSQDANYALAFPATEVNLSGCYDTLTIHVTEPPLLEVSLRQDHFVSCYGFDDGKIIAHANGGRAYLSGDQYYPYQYEWFTVDGGTLTPVDAPDSVAANRPSAVYRLRVTDRNQISTWSSDFELEQPDALRINFTTSQLLCNGDSNGTSRAVVQGGTPSYRYTWSTEDTTSQISNLTDGSYSLVVTDARGCTTYSLTEVIVPNGLEVDTVLLDYPTCNGYMDGSIDLTIKGGRAPYRYAWQHGANSSVITNLGQGEYHVLITDANGCFINRDYILEDPARFPVNLGADRALCKDQVLDMDVTMADPAAQYAWLRNGIPFASTAIVQLVDAGTYHLRITDSNGCLNEDEIKIERNDGEIAASITVATRVPLNGRVRVANISYPYPDRVEWILPQEATILEKTDGYVDISFSKKGEYAIGLTSFRGSCEATVFSPVRVVDRSELGDYQTPVEPYIKQFMVNPNPNDGRFTATVELREPGDFALILHTAQGTLIAQKEIRQQSFSKVDFDISAQVGKGIYVLQLITSQGNSTFKVVVN